MRDPAPLASPPAPGAPRRAGPLRWALVLLGAAAGAAALAVLRTPLERAPSGPAEGALQAAPLRPRGPAAAAGPRFRRLDPAACGVVFTNELQKANTYQYLTNGAGLAVGDYDGDGWLDLYLVGQDGPNRLFRQTAPLQFADVTAAAGGVDGGAAWGTGACFADVDGDGDLDLYVCNLEAKNLLYVNQGNGTFREDAARFGLDLAAASMMAAFADYDRDGHLDLYLLTNRALHAGWAQTPEVLQGIRPPADTRRPAAAMVPTLEQLARLGELQRTGRLQDDAAVPAELRDHFLAFRGQPFMAGEPDRLLRQQGGRFVEVSAAAGIADHGMGLSATWFDYDGDGWQDLYVANDLESPDTLYQNQRDGTFRKVTGEVLPHTAYYGMGSDAADVDGDGHLDLITADMSMTTHKKAKVLMGDMQKQRDVLIHARPPQYMRNALLRNTGRGRFQEAAFLAGVASTDWTWSVLFGDLDNDTRIDLFATNGIARFDMDPDLENRVNALWAQQRQQAAIDLIQNVRKVPEKNLALRQTDDLRFAKTGADWGLDLEAVSHGAALADLDGDGDLDVVVNNWNEPAAVYANTGTDGHAVVVALRGQRSERSGCGARVQVELADGRQLVRELTLARGYLSGQAPELHFGLGPATRLQRLVVQWPSGHRQEFPYLAVDQRYTITEPATAPPPAAAPAAAPAPWFTPAAAPPFAHRENDFDDFVREPLLPAQQSRQGPGLCLGDADGDGRQDLFVGGARGQPGALFRGTADGWQEVAGPWRDDAAAEDLGCLWLDHDGDGDLDLFVASGGNEVPAGDPSLQDRLYRNEGGGRFVRDLDALPERRDASGHAAAADFDGDGDPDLFVAGRQVPGAYPDAPPSRLYRNDGGRFIDATAELAPDLLGAGLVQAAIWTDADGDGRPDLLLAAHWQPLRLLRNTGRGFADATAAAGLAATPGWWNSLVAWDADGDGDLDYVAGNQGLNTKYKASADHPARLYFGDFDDDGRRDLVEAKYEGDTLLPVRGRSCSSQAMPVLARRFPTYDQFASATLREIYTPQKLQDCGQLQAVQLASVWLQNDGQGRFTVRELPRRAQLAPLYGMVVLGDLLVAGENSHAPEPETGRHDGGTGLVLRATPAGPEVVPPAVHGLVFFGDRKGLVAHRRGDGSAELLFGTNDGPVVAYRSTGLPPFPALPAAAAAAAGPRWFVRRKGQRTAAEAAAGSGHLGQSPAPLPPPDAVEVVWRNAAGTTTTAPLAR